MPGILGALACGCSRRAGLTGSGPQTWPTPTAGSKCNQEPAEHADRMIVGMGMHWAGVEHGYDEPGGLYVCSLFPEYGGSVSFFGLPDGVTVEPAVAAIDRVTGIARVEVRVAEGATEDEIVAQVETEASGTTMHGPTIETDDDHWSFDEPTR
ncbi:MAG: hypothetical protein ACRDO8_10195 [Nocardioidaceae bacterium]